jgi:hypothetical protein
VADDAVRCEPVSRGNSLLTGKFAGKTVNSNKAQLTIRMWIQDIVSFSGLTSREFFALEQGKFLPLQGIQGISFESWAA